MANATVVGDNNNSLATENTCKGGGYFADKYLISCPYGFVHTNLLLFLLVRYGLQPALIFLRPYFQQTLKAV